MSDTENILILIPARGGSKRLPRKNILPLEGKPLISHTLDAALESGISARIVVTSDDSEILEHVKYSYKEKVIAYQRPTKLGQDTTPTIDVIVDALEAQRLSGFDAGSVILLQPTSPLRKPQDISGAYDKYNLLGRTQSVVGVCKVEHPTSWIGTLGIDSMIEGIDFTGRRSQDCIDEYRINGAIYISSVSNIVSKSSLFSDKNYAFIMPIERSIDIDNEHDLDLCKFLISREDNVYNKR